jgi:hypothetical protein
VPDHTKYGRFDDANRCFVITRPDTPRPWINCATNGRHSRLISHTGSRFSQHLSPPAGRGLERHAADHRRRPRRRRKEATAGAENRDSGQDLQPPELDTAARFAKVPSTRAGIAQLVERHLAKVDVAGSSPVSRSISRRPGDSAGLDSGTQIHRLRELRNLDLRAGA